MHNCEEKSKGRKCNCDLAWLLYAQSWNAGRDCCPGKPGPPGPPGKTPHIGTNGNWFIGTKDTGVRARGRDGQPGADGEDGTNGISPHIGSNGNWFVGTTDTGVKAQGPQGPPGPGGGGGEFMPEEEIETGATYRGRPVYRQSIMLENVLIESTTRYTINIGTPGYFSRIVQCGGEWGDESVLTMPVNVNTGLVRTLGESNYGTSALYKLDNGQLVFVYENDSVVDMQNGFVELWFDYTKNSEVI